MTDLSILIPARNEMFLSKTIENILQNIEGDTEIIAVLDGEWADPPIVDDKRVTLIYYPESIGQRAATNQACRISRAKYIMKVDAHCAFDKGFDVKMMAEMHDDWTMVPLMKNLHAFDWVCPDGHRRYQSPSGPCKECGKETKRDIIWYAKDSPCSVSYCFDSTPHFQYFREFSRRPEGKGEITETMSLQGSCFMCTREKFWELNLCDESFGSWGSQGIEVACKTWLSGGKVMCNKKTWYGHMFRTQGGDFGFPYPQSGNKQEYAKKFARNLFFNNKWPKQIYPLSWLIEKFWPVPGWTDTDLAKLKEAKMENEKITLIPEIPVKEKNTENPGNSLKKGIVFFTDNQLQLNIAHAVQKTLSKISKDLNIPIVSVSLKPMPHFGTKNIHIKMKRGYEAYFTQILTGLENSDANIIYLCEHDVLYHPSHFDFIPPEKDKFYYNQNWWKLSSEDGHALHFDANQVSGCIAYRETLITEYKRIIAEMKKNGFSYHIGFEPGAHQEGRMIPWKSKHPIVDIRHNGNLTSNRWRLSQYRDKSIGASWIESDTIPTWGKFGDTFKLKR